MSDFKSINNFWFWCQKVLPLVYDDSISYYEVLCKMSDYLNQVINNVNALPDLIDDKIKEYISSGEIQNVLNELLQNYFPIDVKNPPADLTPAVGDGTTDDTSALQNIINYAADHNLPMIFPAGVYRVSTLTIAEEAHFLGVGNPTIFKLNNTENTLINVNGSFTAFGMTFNANIAGVINPVNAITGTCDNISLSKCSVTGCVSGVDAFVSGIMQIENCTFSNFTDYAIHAEGNGRLFVDGVEVEGVANSGAMRFIKIDTSNSMVNNLTSLATVPVGIEITGDFNEVKARIPNCANPVNDEGENNSYDIIGSSLQKKVTEKISYTANESVETVNTNKSINATDIILKPTNPLTYKTPDTLSEYFRTIPFKDYDSTAYNVLVSTEKTPELLFNGAKSVKNYGAKGDGVTDDTEAIKAAIAGGSPVYFPLGRYRITEPLHAENVFIIGAGKQQAFIEMDGAGPIIYAGSRFVMCHITLCFTDASNAGYNEKVAINCFDNLPLQRTIIYDVNIYECGTAIKSGEQPVFSVVFDTMEINDFTYAAIDIDTADSTQNAFRNIYAASTKNPEYMVIINNRMSSVYFENINLEWTAPKHSPLCLFGILNVQINGLQFEQITLTTNTYLISLDCREVTINRLTNIFNNIAEGNTYSIVIDMASCVEFGDFSTPDMKFSGKPAKLVINEYTMWGFTFNSNSTLTFLRRNDTEHPANVIINGFNAITYNNDIDKYSLYCQVSDNTCVVYNVNGVYGASTPNNDITKGQTYFDTAANTLKYWDGTTWKSISST